MNRASCMGGWCAVRDRCGHYRPGDRMAEPVERMCDPKSREMFAGDKWTFLPVVPDSWEAERADRVLAA